MEYEEDRFVGFIDLIVKYVFISYSNLCHSLFLTQFDLSVTHLC